MRYARLDPDALMRTMSEYPRLGSSLFWSVALEEAMLRERIVGLGQRSAREHTAHLIVEMVERQRHSGVNDYDVLFLPVSQILLADALGISPVHTNRTVRRLAREGLIETTAAGITVLDESGLREIGDFEGRFLHADAATREGPR
jgi:CRP-like cAMP-binding protein